MSNVSKLSLKSAVFHDRLFVKGPDLVIHQPDAALDVMDDWCTKHHGEVRFPFTLESSYCIIHKVEKDQCLELLS